MTEESGRPVKLQEACVDEALKVIEELGVENLSLREVARRLGVSHQAPYKHFPSRDHILAAVVARLFAEFAAYLDDRPKTGNVSEDMRTMGVRYLDYARNHPLKYRLMFNTALPAPEQHGKMMLNSRHAFALLQEAITSLTPLDDQEHVDNSTDLDALFVWSTLHGIASILESDTVKTLDLDEQTLSNAPVHILKSIGVVMGCSYAIDEANGPAETGPK